MKKHVILAHISEHTWLWIAGMAALGAVLLLLGLSTPGAFALMLVGILIIAKSQGTDVLTIVTASPTATAEPEKAPAPGPAATARVDMAAQ